LTELKYGNGDEKKERTTGQDSLGSSTTDGTITERQKRSEQNSSLFIDQYSQGELNRSVKKSTYLSRSA
jgi:hypothetical protein